MWADFGSKAALKTSSHPTLANEELGDVKDTGICDKNLSRTNFGERMKKDKTAQESQLGSKRSDFCRLSSHNSCFHGAIRRLAGRALRQIAVVR